MTVDAHLHADWATRLEKKSRSGGVMMINSTVVKCRAITQASRALSTTEAEYHVVITEVAEGLGMHSMMTYVGLSAQVRVWTDSNTTKAIECFNERTRQDQTC